MVFKIHSKKLFNSLTYVEIYLTLNAGKAAHSHKNYSTEWAT